MPDVSNNRLLEYDQPVPYQAPALRRLSPATLAAGAPAFTLAVNGNGFVPSSVVRWQGSPRPTTFINSTQLQAPISAADVAGGGPFDVTEYTPGGGASTSLNLTLYARHSQDAIADVVFGQPSFVTSTLNNPDLAGGANWMNGPTGVAVDVRTGRLFVSDPGNSRVLSWASAAAQANGQAADLVIGQPDLYHYGYAFTATGLAGPEGLAVDLNGNLYVVDGSLNRVTEYDAPLTTGMAATRVFGQGGSFTAHDSNHGGMGPDSLYLPVGVAVDAQGNMYVADSYNDRVLEYDAPLAPGGDTTADRVFGEPNFYTDTAPAPITSAITLYRPEAVAVGAQGQLFVADTVDSRVLEYVSPLTSRVADRVLGQPGFSSIDPPFIPDASSLNDPQGLTVDLQGNLYVGDSGNNRVLEYDAPLTTHAAAARVFGQPSFITDTANAGGLSALSLSNPNQLALDAHGDLFVADWQNSRVLEYDRPLPLLAVFLPLVRR